MGIKAFKASAGGITIKAIPGTIHRKLMRRESRFIRRLIHSERRFLRWFKKHPPSVAFDVKAGLMANRKLHVKKWLAGGVA